MSRLKVIIDAPYNKMIGKRITGKLCRTDHIICKKVNDKYYVWCKYIPIHIRHLWVFNPKIYNINKVMCRITTNLKTMNFKKRLKRQLWK